jgi:GH43 family beta-xylosidase
MIKFESLKSLSRKSLLLMFMSLVLLFSTALGGLAYAANFYNPISSNRYIGGGDPWITQYNNQYIYTQSQGTHISIWKSNTITGLGTSPSKVVFTQGQVNGLTELWAPEAHFINGLWYIYFGAIASNGERVIHVIQSANSDPWSDYTFVGRVNPGNGQWAIDATLGYINNQLYMIWSGGISTGGQNLQIAKMSSPTQVGTPSTIISTPNLNWEHTTGLINEGPQFLQRNGQTFIVYSADGSWSDAYKLGMLTFTGDDPLNAASWSKRQTPLFQSSGDTYGPGHGSFTLSPDGTEYWNVYHAAKRSGSGWDRSIRAQKVNWNPDGTPNLGTPISTRDAQIAPSGENTGAVVFEAENAARTNSNLNCKAGASGGCVVGWMDYPDSSVTFIINALSAGVYPIVIRYTNGSPNFVDSTHNVTVNSSPSQTLTYFSTGSWDTYSHTYMNVQLNAGNNTIRFQKGDNFAELDSLTLYPKQRDPWIFDPNKLYKIINKKSHRAASVYTGSTVQGTDMILYDFINATDQLWKIESVGNGYYRFINSKSGQAMSIKNGGTANDSRVHIWAYLGGYQDQDWAILPGSTGYVKILNRASGRGLSVVNGATPNNSLLHIWDYILNEDDLDWVIEPVN